MNPIFKVRIVRLVRKRTSRNEAIPHTDMLMRCNGWMNTSPTNELEAARNSDLTPWTITSRVT